MSLSLRQARPISVLILQVSTFYVVGCSPMPTDKYEARETGYLLSLSLVWHKYGVPDKGRTQFFCARSVPRRCAGSEMDMFEMESVRTNSGLVCSFIFVLERLDSVFQLWVK